MRIHWWAIAVAAFGAAAWILKDTWPHLKKMLDARLKKRVKNGIDFDQRKLTPMRSIFFESEVKTHLGFFGFLSDVIMADLVKEGWCAWDGVDDEKGTRWQRRF